MGIRRTPWSEPISISAKALRVNTAIRSRDVRVIGSAGEQLGILPIFDALRKAQEKGMDLVEIAPEGKPPVCRIMDYGRFRYEQAKQDRQARRNQKSVEVKEIKLRPKIDVHDYQTKVRHVQRFLGEGFKVKVTIMFRGREMVHKELGHQILERVVAETADLGTVEQMSKLEGNNLSLLIAAKPQTKQKPRAATPAAPEPVAAGERAERQA